MPEQDDLWLAAGMGILILASLATWAYLLALRARRGYILPYEPRPAVPWAGWATLLAIIMTGLAVLVAITEGADPGQAAEAPPPDEFADVFEMVERMVSMIVFQTIVTGAFFVVVILAAGANQRDLGLPEYAHEALHDVMIGVLAYLAAIVPAWGVQLAIVLFRGEPEKISEHPLIEMIMREPNLIVMLLAFVLAVFVAPLSEEIMYRLLLQGWLEKWEDWRLGWRKVARAAQAEGMAEMPEPGEAFDPTITLTPIMLTPSWEDVPINDGPSLIAADEEPAAPAPPPRGLWGLPHGWMPILISSVLFSLAHVGAGTDPLPLFPLALILGYTYQRTHRIVPCIVTHFLFNFVSMMALWRIVSQMK